MNLKQQYTFVKKLQAFYKSGKSLSETFDALASNETSYSLKRSFGDISAQIKAGSSLSEALDSCDILDEVYCKLIHVGEVSGRLDKILNQILELQLSIIGLRRKIIGASIYPITLILLYGLLLFGLFFGLIPAIVGFMRNFNVDPPTFLLFISSFGGYIFSPLGCCICPACLLFVGLFIYLYLNIDSLTEFRSRALLFVPGFGHLEKLKNMYTFIFTMKICYDSGLSVMEAMELSAFNVSNTYLFNIFAEAYEDVKKGNTVSGALLKTNVFNSEMIDLIRVGEESGTLDESYRELIRTIDDKIKVVIAVMLALIKPLGILIGLMFLCGVFATIGSILLSVFCKIKSALPH